MAYLGNEKGPRESEILNRLSSDFFGITPAQLESDIEWNEDAERRGEVQPVHVDEDGRPFIVYSRPKGKDVRFYLEDHGFKLEGKIKTFSEDETNRWENRDR